MKDPFATRLFILLLSSKRLADVDQIEAASKSGHDLPEGYLVEQGLITRKQLAEAAAESFELEPAPTPLTVVPGVLSPEQQKTFQAIPISASDNEVVLAVCAPCSSEVESSLSQAVGRQLRFQIIDRITQKQYFETGTTEVPKPSAPPLASPPPAAKAAPPPEPEDPVIGGRYRRGEHLLDGRFSSLYRGVDTQTGLPVVIRHLEDYSQVPGGGVSNQARLQTLKEGRIFAKLRHPSLPRVRQLVQDADDLYLISDHVAGTTLAEEVETQGAFGPELVRRYMTQLLQAVNFLHSGERPIIHRDLRPNSILLTPNGGLRLLEFGLAKMADANAPAGATSFRSAGDANFAAPEQLMGDQSSTKNDLYSVGALTYYMATGEKPPESLTRFAGGGSMAALPGTLDYKVQDVLRKCLAPRPEDRAETAEELLNLLEEHEIRRPLLLLEDEHGESAVEDAIIDPEGPTEPLGPDAQTKPLKMKPESSTPVTKRLSMWKLLFGRKKEQEGKTSGGKGFGEDTAVRRQQMKSVPFADLASMDLDRDVCRVLPESLCRTINGICIGKLSDRDITVAVKDPTDVHIYDQIAIASKGKFNPTLMRADADLIVHAQEFVYRGDHLGPETRWSKFLDLKRLHDVALETTNEQAVLTFGDEALEGPIVEAVDRIIKEAIAAEASDIHLEPFESGMDIRYRIDGVLRVVAHYPRQAATAIVKRLKVMANMDIAQERVTQGGRISLRVGSGEYDLRVSIVPVPVGESVVMRILKKGAFTLTLADLGFSEEKEKRFRTILSQPHGMILVCGPTGSGKSTTLYASLKEIQRPDRKLLTAEDPIEYQMPGIIQVQMNTAPREEEKRVTFSKTLREFLRQDPDVILVGEIRDQETAEIGIQAALTGHLLLSTLHTNDSVGIIARLRDMDCEPFQIGSVLLGGLAQRLARRICPDCRQPVEVPDEMKGLFHDNGIKNPRMFKGKGCRRCHQTGHRGRVGLYELLEITPEIRAHINRGDQEEEIRKTAASQGFKELLYDGLQKVCNGQVTLEEVLRVCKTV